MSRRNGGRSGGGGRTRIGGAARRIGGGARRVAAAPRRAAAASRRAVVAAPRRAVSAIRRPAGRRQPVPVVRPRPIVVVRPNPVITGMQIGAARNRAKQQNTTIHTSKTVHVHHPPRVRRNVINNPPIHCHDPYYHHDDHDDYDDHSYQHSEEPFSSEPIPLTTYSSQPQTVPKAEAAPAPKFTPNSANLPINDAQRIMPVSTENHDEDAHLPVPDEEMEQELEGDNLEVNNLDRIDEEPTEEDRQSVLQPEQPTQILALWEKVEEEEKQETTLPQPNTHLGEKSATDLGPNNRPLIADLPKRKSSLQHPGVVEAGDLTKSLLPDDMIRGGMLQDPTYINAWMELNVGFLERFKKIKGSFRNKNMNFIEHMRGKKWQNVKKICPEINYQAFLDNYCDVKNKYMNDWEAMNHKYLIREVNNLPAKACALCSKNFKTKEKIALMPCLDIMHFKCLKDKFKGFLFFKQKEQSCVCSLDVQEMYDAVKVYLHY